MSGWQKSFVHARTGKRATSLRELYPHCSPEERQLSAAFYERSLEGRGPGRSTPLAGIERGPGPLAAAPADSDRADLYARLAGALAASLPGTAEVDVAVSGGIDSWLLAAILQAEGYRVRAWYLESGIPGYCERDRVEHIARTMGIACQHIRVTADSFLTAAPEFVALSETPIYNLHPVSKWLLADALSREGVGIVVTGDGADQVMRWEWDCDLLPMTITCFQRAGVRLVAPFLAAPVIGFCREPCLDKRPVRELAQRLKVPQAGKHPTFVPPLALPDQPRAMLPVGTAVEYRAACLSYTTGLLLQTIEEHQPCAASLA